MRALHALIPGWIFSLKRLPHLGLPPGGTLQHQVQKETLNSTLHIVGLSAHWFNEWRRERTDTGAQPHFSFDSTAYWTLSFMGAGSHPWGLIQRRAGLHLWNRGLRRMCSAFLCTPGKFSLISFAFALLVCYFYYCFSYKFLLSVWQYLKGGERGRGAGRERDRDFNEL